MKLFFSLLALIGVSLSAYGYFYLLNDTPIRFGSHAAPDQVPVWRLVAGFLITVAGVVLGVAYRKLQAMRRRGRVHITKPHTFLRDLLRSIDLWVGLCAAPLIFALLMQSTQGASWPGLIAVALQNGFCCALIADGVIAGAAVPGGTLDEQLSSKE